MITYANDAFCAPSGYSREELLGKHNRIVRHPDAPKELIAQMWQTITAKKRWKGVIKNRTKAGGYYIVDATVKPIVDRSGAIVEYISMRRDITEKRSIANTSKKSLAAPKTICVNS